MSEKPLYSSEMSLRLLTLLFISAAALFMIGIKSQGREEKLSLDDGTLSTPVLPFDKKTSKRKYETATFGLG